MVSVWIPLVSASVLTLESASAWQILVPMISVEPVNVIPQNLHGYITGTLVTLTSLLRPQEDCSEKFFYPQYLLNQ